MKKRIGEILIEAGLITEEQLADALALQKKRYNLIGAIMVQLGYIEEDVLIEYLKDTGTVVHLKETRIHRIRRFFKMKRPRDSNR